MTSISSSLQSRLIVPSFVKPDFGFLPGPEAYPALCAYNDVSDVVASCGPFPEAVLFDLDWVLYDRLSDRVIGRSVGALYAFANSGIPVGIYSHRPYDQVLEFLHAVPEVRALLAFDQSGKTLILSRSDYDADVAFLCSGLKCARLSTIEKYCKDNPGMKATVPVLDFESAGIEERIRVPKFITAEGVILVDDCDYRVEYEKILAHLQGGLEDPSPLYRIAKMSARLLWHVGKAGPGEKFSAQQLQALRAVMGGIVVAGNS